MRKRVLSLLVTLAVLAPAALTAAQQTPGNMQDRFGMQNSARLSAAAALPEDAGTPKAGASFTLNLSLKTQAGWKIQAGKDSGDDIPPYIPTTIDLTAPKGWSISAIQWPKAKEFTIGEGDWSETLKGYSGDSIATVTIAIPANATAGEHKLEFKVGYQACDATSCEMPTDLKTSLTVAIEGGDTTAQPTAPETTNGDSEQEPQGIVTPGITNEVMTKADAPALQPEIFGIKLPRPDGPVGLILVMLLSIVAGAVLNLTPCVLPVIPIKIMTISAHANSPGKSMALGLAMAAGVVAFWVAIGIPAALIAGAADPSRIFGIWWVTFSIGAIIAVMALGIMGMFVLQLPQSVYAINPKADNALGSFLFGVMTGVLGLPCFGFVAGGLLFASATLPTTTILSIFTSIGIGMAAPYLLLSAKPGLVEKIPRTGPASELVKQIMGLLLFAAAAYFIGAGLVALVSEKPYMARQLHWWAVAIFASLSGLWLIVRTFQITKKPGKRAAFTVIGLIIGGIAVLFALDSTAKAKETWEKLESNRLANLGSSFVPGAWNEYSPAAFEAAREEGYIVVLDFTAEWCINCKALKAAVLNRDPVKTELAKDDVVNFTVDLTSTAAPGWDFLNELGQTGIPQLFVWTPGSDTPWQSNAYTPPQVMTALEHARSTSVARR